VKLQIFADRVVITVMVSSPHLSCYYFLASISNYTASHDNCHFYLVTLWLSKSDFDSQSNGIKIKMSYGHRMIFFSQKTLASSVMANSHIIQVVTALTSSIYVHWSLWMTPARLVWKKGMRCISFRGEHQLASDIASSSGLATLQFCLPLAIELAV